MYEAVSDATQRVAARRFRALWSAWETNRDLVMMGAHSPGVDPVLDEAIERHPDLKAFVAQDETVSAEDAVAQLVERFGPLA